MNGCGVNERIHQVLRGRTGACEDRDYPAPLARSPERLIEDRPTYSVVNGVETTAVRKSLDVRLDRLFTVVDDVIGAEAAGDLGPLALANWTPT